jgi:EmrB/QacA subfamily drug resistance transporter
MTTELRLIDRRPDMPVENKKDERWLALLILCAGFLMIVLDMTIVNVALPSIKNDLGFSQAGLAWVVNAYLIAYAGLLLLAGRLGDLIGRKRVFLIGLVMFTGASLLCGLSVSQPMLIAARFLQGIGGAVSSAVILGMVVTMFSEPAERARAIGVFSFVASAGASIGLLAGGIITQAVSWHWIFFVNLPIGVVIAILAARVLESDRGLGLNQGADILGALLVTAGLMLGVYAIVQSADYGLVSKRTFGFGGVAIILLAAFVLRQAKGRNPLLPLRLFLVPNVSAANVIQALGGVAMFAFFFFSSLYMQRVLGYGPLTIGLAFLPVAVLMGTLSVAVTDKLIMRFGARNVLLVGFGVISVALLLAARGPVSGDYLRDLFPALALLGIGGGLAFPSLAVVAMAGTSPSEAGLASGLLNTTGQVGAALGLAVLATVSTNRTTDLIKQGQSTVVALSGGYHLAWAIGAGLAIASIVIAATMLKLETTSSRQATSKEEVEEAS